jgi:hypothetical protein
VPLAAVASYEAPFVIPGSREVAQDPAGRIREMVASGRRGDAVRYWMTDVVRAPDHVLASMEGAPWWPGLEALTHTLPYDIALTGDQGIPAALSAIAIPVLVLGGSASPAGHDGGLRSRHSARGHRAGADRVLRWHHPCRVGDGRASDP